MKTKRDLIGLGAVMLVLLIIASFADLNISHGLYNAESIFGKIFEIVGEFPASFIASFCAMAIAVIQKRKNDNKMNLKSMGSLVLSVLLAYAAGFLLITYWDGPKALGFVFMGIVLIVEYMLVKALVDAHGEELYRAAKLGLELYVIVILSFNLAKLGWGRERYRHMIAAGSFAGFTPWYLPQGLASGNEFMSFPSGHSANAAIVMWITLLPTFVPKLKDKEVQLKIVSCVWIGMVMVSRIMMGAHFLSDVTVGMAISLLLFYLLYQRNYKPHN